MKKSRFQQLLSAFELNDGDELIEPQHTKVRETIDKFQLLLQDRRKGWVLGSGVENESIFKVVNEKFSALEKSIIKLHIMTLPRGIVFNVRDLYGACANDIIDLMIGMEDLDKESMTYLFGEDFYDRYDSFLKGRLSIDYAQRNINNGKNISLFFKDSYYVSSYLSKDDEISMWRGMPDYMKMNYQFISEQLDCSDRG